MPATIQELIKDHQERTGDSLYDIARRSKDVSGTEVSQKYLWRLSTGDVKAFPKNTETFVAIAAGLETTELAVLLGYAVQLGIPARMPRFASALPYAIDDVPENVRDAFLGLARALALPQGRQTRTPADDEPDLSGVGGMLEDHASPGRVQTLPKDEARGQQ